jgi:uncharacterized protein YneR
MKETYSVAVTIRAYVPIEADSYTEAETITNKYIDEYDFGKLKDIDWDIDYVLDENGNYKAVIF